MGFFNFVRDKHVPRSGYWLYLFRIGTICLTFASIGITADLIKDLMKQHCKPSWQMDLNLGVAALSTILLSYNILSTGPHSYLRILPHSHALQLLLDILLLCLWGAAAGTSVVRCNELCNACSAVTPDYVFLDKFQACYCRWNGGHHLDFSVHDEDPTPARTMLMLLKRKGGSGGGGGGVGGKGGGGGGGKGGGKGTKGGKSGGSNGSMIDGRMITNIIAALFMIIILCGAIHYFLKARRAAKADYHAVEGGAGESKEGRDSEEGVAVTTETVEPDKQDTTYYGARAQLADPLPPFDDRSKEQRQTS